MGRRSEKGDGERREGRGSERGRVGGPGRGGRNGRLREGERESRERKVREPVEHVSKSGIYQAGSFVSAFPSLLPSCSRCLIPPI